MRLVRLFLPTLLLASALAAQSAFARIISPTSAKAAQPSVAMIYGKWCSDCHSRPSGPGSIALRRKYQGAVPAILEQRTDLTPDYVRYAVRKGVSFMPSFRKTEISDAELTLLADYLAPAPGSKKASRKAAGRTHR